ncbi:MAG TPA: TetR family transcriptional regulator [Pseudonocardia sp.]
MGRDFRNGAEHMAVGNGDDTTRSRLLSTAERLFASQGVDTVSLREIIRAAGVRHSTAVQYHFGDREGLLSAILEHHCARVDIRRDAMLQQYEADRITDPRSLAAALIRPLAAELTDPRGRLFLQIYSQLILRAGSTILTDSGSSIWRWRAYTEPHLDPLAAQMHPRFAALTYAATELARRARERAHTDDRLFVSHIIDVVTAILCAPLSEESRRLKEERDNKIGQRAAG